MENNILVTRLRNKNVEIWKELKNWDVTVFSETWVEETLERVYMEGVVGSERKENGKSDGGYDRGDKIKSEKD